MSEQNDYYLTMHKTNAAVWLFEGNLEQAIQSTRRAIACYLRMHKLPLPRVHPAKRDRMYRKAIRTAESEHRDNASRGRQVRSGRH